MIFFAGFDITKKKLKMRFLFAGSPATIPTTILLLFYLTYSVESLSLEGIKNKTTDIIKLGTKTGEGIVKKGEIV